MFSFQIPALTHNSIVLTSKVSYLLIKSVYTVDSKNNKIILIDHPVELNSIYDKVGKNYPAVNSNVIYFDIVADPSLTLSDLLQVNVTNSIYNSIGSYTSNSYSCVAGKQTQIILEYDQIEDIYINCSIDVKFFDKYGNIRLQDVIPIIGNEDGIMIQEFTSQDVKFSLPVGVDSVQDIVIFTNNTKIDQSNYSLLDPLTVSFDSRNLDSFIVLYVPSFYNSGEYYKVSDYLYINKNNIIKHEIKDITRLDYRFTIRAYNFEQNSVDETITIKKLGVVTY